MKRFLLLGMIAGGMLAAPLQADAGSSRQQVVITTTVVGATAGAVIGAGNNQMLEGALIGGMIGAVTGMVIAQNEPATVYRTVYQPQPTYRRIYYRPRQHVRRYATGSAYYHPRRAQRMVRHHAWHEYMEHEAREHVYHDD